VEPTYTNSDGTYPSQAAFEKFARGVQHHLAGKSLRAITIVSGQQLVLQFGEDVALRVSINRETQPVSLILELLEIRERAAGGHPELN
jgi:hypothetical protein